MKSVLDQYSPCPYCQLEPKIKDALVAAKGQISDETAVADSILQPLMDDEHLAALDFAAVESTWQSVRGTRDRFFMIVDVLIEVLCAC